MSLISVCLRWYTGTWWLILSIVMIGVMIGVRSLMSDMSFVYTVWLWAITQISSYIILRWMIPFINKDIPLAQQQYYKTLPSYLRILLIGIIIIICWKYGWTDASVLYILIVVWWFIFFDARYFAVMAWYMLLRIVVFSLGDAQELAEQSAIFLYYYLIITVVFSLIEGKLKQYFKL